MIREPLPAELSSEWPEPARRPRRRWRDKVRVALRGVKLGVRGHSSFAVHFFFAALAVAAAVTLECSLAEWCLLFLCVGGVIAAELFNSAFVTLFRGLDEASRARWHGCLEISAGAVLVASATALLVGATIFLHRFLKVLQA
jgi:diacylglycerol kinase